MLGSTLRVLDLWVTYGGVHAVDGLSLEATAGECTALIGANGAGKTSTLRGISGLGPARSRGIWIDDRRIDRERPERRAAIGLGHVLEGRHIFPRFSVRENLELGQVATTRNDTKENLDLVYKVFPDLAHMQSVKAGSLSGGQQQFLAIARAMMARPTVLLLDEPTLGLAPKLVATVIEVIHKLLAAGTTVLLVEQSLEVVQEVAVTVHLLSHGKIVGMRTGQDPELAAFAHAVYLT